MLLDFNVCIYSIISQTGRPAEKCTVNSFSNTLNDINCGLRT